MDQNVNDNQVEKAVAFRDPRRNEANSSKDFQTIATVCNDITKCLAQIELAGSSSERARGKRKILMNELVDDRASRGCSLCLRIFSSMNSQRRDAMRRCRDQTIGFGARFEIEYEIRCQGRGDYTIMILYRSHSDVQHLWAIISVCYVPTTTDEDNVDSLASCTGICYSKKWIATYTSSHAECFSTSYTPTRLIILGSDHELVSSPHLAIGSDIVTPPTYATLSHRWGSYAPLRLLSTNISDLESEIMFEDLPKTFHDAVVAYRKLGIEYLWIDSLCIIQDSIEDWQAESARMSQVYLNGACNLAATSAHDSRDDWCQKTANYVAPSWSRTSVRGQFGYSSSIPEPLGTEAPDWIDIIEVNIDLTTENQFGQVRSASLLVRGRLAEVRFLGGIRTADGYQTLLAMRRGFKGTSDEFETRLDLAEFRMHQDVTCPDCSPGDANRTLFLLPAVISFGVYYCLILEKLPYSTQEVLFSRWGYFEAIGANARELLEDGLNTFDRHSQSLPHIKRSPGPSSDGKRTYIAEIV
ncbi:HET-domain-containing protein [Acephala macrosclerotiorum]|nr:HET-domain-containing protein [Acephala macrosclerotiorum]